MMVPSHEIVLEERNEERPTSTAHTYQVCATVPDRQHPLISLTDIFTAFQLIFSYESLQNIKVHRKPKLSQKKWQNKHCV